MCRDVIKCVPGKPNVRVQLRGGEIFLKRCVKRLGNEMTVSGKGKGIKSSRKKTEEDE